MSLSSVCMLSCEIVDPMASVRKSSCLVAVLPEQCMEEEGRGSGSLSSGIINIASNVRNSKLNPIAQPIEFKSLECVVLSKSNEN